MAGEYAQILPLVEPKRHDVLLLLMHCWLAEYRLIYCVVLRLQASPTCCRLAECWALHNTHSMALGPKPCKQFVESKQDLLLMKWNQHMDAHGADDRGLLPKGQRLINVHCHPAACESKGAFNLHMLDSSRATPGQFVGYHRDFAKPVGICWRSGYVVL
jgi:hypothetical protein